MTDAHLCPCCNARLKDTGVLFDMATGHLVIAGEHRHIEAQAAAVLGALARYPGCVLTREQLYDTFTWRRAAGELPQLKLANVYVSMLRKNLAGSPLRIENNNANGYRLTGGTIRLVDSSVDDGDLWEWLDERADHVSAQA